MQKCGSENSANYYGSKDRKMELHFFLHFNKTGAVKLFIIFNFIIDSLVMINIIMIVTEKK